jgi:hypothetical protein
MSLIRRNLLKAGNWPANPAYRLPAMFSITCGQFCRNCETDFWVLLAGCAHLVEL